MYLFVETVMDVLSENVKAIYVFSPTPIIDKTYSHKMVFYDFWVTLE